MIEVVLAQFAQKVIVERDTEALSLINIIDCFYEPEKCEGITNTPTWVFQGEKYVGVQSIEELKENPKNTVDD